MGSDRAAARRRPRRLAGDAEAMTFYSPPTQPACTNPAHRMLNHAPVPCPQCRGWLDHDGTVLSTPDMLARYPHMAAVTTRTPKQQLPDYQPSTSDGFWEINRIVGALARTGLALIFSGIALLILIVILAKLVG